MSDEQFPPFLLSVRIEGPKRTEETTFGPRDNRDDLACFDVEVSGHRAWLIFQKALESALAQEAVAALLPRKEP